MSRTNYIFIDFENVPESDLDRIANRPVQVILVLGEKHRSLPVARMQKVLAYREQVALVQTGPDGKNATDSVLAYYAGLHAKVDPEGRYYILSGDQGSDPLVGHLRDQHIQAARIATFGEVPVLMNLEERVKYLAGYFKEHPASLPQKRLSLRAYIQQVFSRVLSSPEVAATIKGLVAEKIISVSKKRDVAYLMAA